MTASTSVPYPTLRPKKKEYNSVASNSTCLHIIYYIVVPIYIYLYLCFYLLAAVDGMGGIGSEGRGHSTSR